MGNVVIKGKEEKIFFSASNYYGANMKVDVFDDDLGVFINQGVPMTEMLEPITAYTSTITGDTAKDTKVVVVDTTTGLVSSDRVSIDGDIYRVTDITGNTITLHRGLASNVIDGAVIDKVGNMGIFRIRLIITKNGDFVIQAKDTKFGIQKSDSISIKDQSLEDMFTFTNSEINQNERIIKENTSFSIII